MSVRIHPTAYYSFRLIAGVLVALLAPTLAGAQANAIGSGYPGLKVAVASADAIAIYEDEPFTVGAGLIGGYRSRHITVLLDHGYGFDQQLMRIPEQLYPLDPDSAFSSTGGRLLFNPTRWELSERKATGYRLVKGQLTIIPDVLAIAAVQYKLQDNESFLGRIDNRVFFWRDFSPAKLFWREIDSEHVYSIQIPEGVLDFHGITRGIKKDIGLVVLRKSPGQIHYAPNTFSFLEFALAEGKYEAAPNASKK